MLISSLLITMSNFLPLFSQEQFKQLRENIRIDFFLSYQTVGRFIVQRDLSERYNLNKRAILTDEEINCLALLVKERTELIKNQSFPFYKNEDPEKLLLGNALFEKIAEQLANSSQEAKQKIRNNSRPVQIKRNRITPLNLKEDLDLEPKATKKRKSDLEPRLITKKSTAQFSQIKTTKPKNDEVHLHSDEETPDLNSDIEVILENISSEENSINPDFNLQEFDPLQTPEFSAEKETPSVLKEPEITSTFENNKEFREAIIYDESLIVTAEIFSDNTFNKQKLESFYNRAKKQLGKIQSAFKKESTQLDQFIYDTNHYSFNPEEKAINSFQEILLLQAPVSAYYFSKSSRELTLQAIRTELLFVHSYLINEDLFKKQIALLEKCSQACTTILFSKKEKSEKFKDEANDLNASIKNYYLPTTHFNFAVYNFKKINNKVLVACEDESEADLGELIIDLENSIKRLKDAYQLLKNAKYKGEPNIIINFLAKSYEDLADFKGKKVDLMLEKNLNDDSILNLLKEIKSDYHDSHSYISNQEIWLSILYAQHRLIEAYTANGNYFNESLDETIGLIDLLTEKGLSASEELFTNLEILYYLLYACSKAYGLTNPDAKEFPQKALNFMQLYIDHIVNFGNTFDQEYLSAEIINSLIQLKLISKGGKWTLQSAINKACSSSQNDNHNSNIESIVYSKKITTPEKTSEMTVIIRYKNAENLRKKLQNCSSTFFQKAESEQDQQSDSKCDKNFQL